MFSVYSLCFTVLSYSLKARKHEEIQLKQPLGEIADESININLLQSNVLTTDEFYTVRCYFAYAIPPTFYNYANQCKSNLLFENKYNKDKEHDGQSQSLLVAYLLKSFLSRWNILLYRSSACHRSLSAISQNA